MNFLHAILFGIIEGITEFLPISSTGHLILAEQLLHLPETEFMKSFSIVIQLGAILAVVKWYGQRLFAQRELLQRVLVAFLPTAVIGLALHSIVKRYLLGNATVVAWSLLVGGVFLIAFELWYGHKLKVSAQGGPALGGESEKFQMERSVTMLSYRQAFFVGVFQSIAIIPGVSRSAATIVGGLLLGLSRTAIVEFSFLLAIPTMAAATALDLLKSGVNFTYSEMGLLGIGFSTAFFVSLAVIRWLLRYVQQHTFTVFGVYRVVMGLLFLIFVLSF